MTMLELSQIFGQSTVQYSFAFSTLLFVSGFYIFRYHICKNGSHEKTREKQTSWILTLISSLICTVVSIPFVIQFFCADLNMQLLSTDNQFHTAFVCFFITYLILDLILGCIYYRKRITLMTGWIHHLFYIVLLTCFMRLQISSLFTVSSILELPTLVLAAGSMVHEWRSDLLFGTTFFVLRLVAHAWMMVNLKRYHRIEFMWVIALVIYPLHIYWFYGIIQIQLRKFINYRKMQHLAQKAKYPI